MRKLFLIGFLFLVNSLGFAQNQDWTATIRIQPPRQIFNEIICYCLEYIPATEADVYDFWDYVDVLPEIDEDGNYVVTSCLLNSLSPNTTYIVRVRALYYDGECSVWNEYSVWIAFRTTTEPGNVEVIISCKPLEREEIAWYPMDIIQELPERVLYRSKEEWEQFC